MHLCILVVWSNMFFIDLVAFDFIMVTTLLVSSNEFLNDVLFDLLGTLHSPETGLGEIGSVTP